MVKNPPANEGTQDTWVRSLYGEDPLEEEMATHSSILAWRIPWMEEPGGLQSMGLQRVRQDQEQFSVNFFHGAYEYEDVFPEDPLLLHSAPIVW